MKIIISPAKKMLSEQETFTYKRLPVFLDEAKQILKTMCGKSYEDIKKIWNCNDKLAQYNYDNIHNIDLDEQLVPALFAYEGIQYQKMAPQVFSEHALEYVDAHLNILSGFYGCLRPFDGIRPYRLEMQSPISIEGSKNLYDYWGKKIYNEVSENSGGLILNLASKEYSKVVEPYIQGSDRFVTVVFGQLEQGKVKQKGTLAKMARGDMVRFLSENSCESLEDVQGFNVDGYEYCKELSDEKNMIFIKEM